MSTLNFKSIGKVYSGGIRSVSDFNLSIENEEFIILLDHLDVVNRQSYG